MRMAQHTMDTTAAAGTIIGACLGFINGVVDKVAAHVQTNAQIWDAIVETAILAFVGATIGFFTSKIWKWIISKITKRKSS